MVYATNLMKLKKFLTANYLTCYLLVRLKLIIPYEIELKHPSFCRLWHDRKKDGAGVVAYVHDDFMSSAHRRNKFEPSYLECLCLDLKDSNNSRFIVLACYRSLSKCKISDFLKSLSLVTEETYKLRNKILVVGDFSLDRYQNEMKGRKPNKTLVDFCRKFSFVNLITEPTWVTEKSKTLMMSFYPVMWKVLQQVVPFLLGLVITISFTLSENAN